MARRKSKPKRPALDVFKEFAYAGGDEWTWRLAVPRRFVMRAVNYYATEAGARRAGRTAARECRLELNK